MANLRHADHFTPNYARVRRGSAIGSAVVVVSRWLMVTIDAMVTRRRSRLHLLSLDDRMLKDIGVTRADVCAEASKPIWRG